MQKFIFAAVRSAASPLRGLCKNKFLHSSSKANKSLHFLGDGLMNVIKIVFVMLLSGLLAAAHAEERVALLIGNGAYPRHAGLFGPLKNPVTDAGDMAKVLRKYGFRISGVALDANRREMEEAVDKFIDALPKNGTGLFYYSGHGVQVEDMNYLIPTGGKFKDGGDVKYQAVNANWILDKMERSGARMNIVILDSCRERLPLESKGFQSKGFGQMGAVGAIISYASSLGSAAWGDSKRRNSIYTEKLLEAMRNGGGLRIEQVFKKARAAVAETTKFKQVPWTGNGLIGDFCFGGCGDEKESAVFRDTLKDGGQGPLMVRIPGGSFRMGDIQGGGASNEKPVHQVSMTKFAMGAYEVTVGEFRRFVKAAGYRTEAEQGDGCWADKDKDGSWEQVKDADWQNPYFSQNDDHPAVCVSWNDAVAYAEWLSGQTGHQYRLPTEAEWEYAARAGRESSRYWGNEADKACRYANGADKTAKEQFSSLSIHDCTDAYVYTSPAGRFQANGFGLYDILGNVWEWTCSEYKKYGEHEENRCSSKNHTNSRRVLRGGSWGNYPWGMRAAYRYVWIPANRNFNIGFRLARTL
ncbi:MAG: SUMF1/EgtB/PvdO family nonheme iron enzyme [Gammaproteobacteria bacterium]|nr:SUMF1/EgtB/PvdO family nonheme iron enzyme [Gammaproteobacteria bacterium]